MIAAHRRAHRRIHALLWPVVVALVVATLATRRPLDAPTDWPGFLAESARPTPSRRTADSEGSTKASEALWSRDEAFGAWPARLALFADGHIELQPRRPLDRPELLLYWVRDNFAGGALPDDARLLGRVTGTHTQRFALPNRATADPADAGSLILYSLGHGEIVASARLDLAPETAPARMPATDPTAP